MAGRRTDVLDVREMIRRFRLGEGDRRVARDLGASRNTVAKYRALATTHGLLQSVELPGPGVVEALLAPPPEGEATTGPKSAVEPHRQFVAEKLEEGVEWRALHQLLAEQRGFAGSYSAVRRFCKRLSASEPEAFLRIETEPGEEAQVDFGYAGEMYEPRLGRACKSWVFVMTLSYSRHQYVEIVTDQTVATWVALHVRALEWFGGAVRRVVIDNLKAAITKASLYDPEVQRSYRTLAEHYGFSIAPCRPRTPRHKGKVESGVRYVKRNGLAGRVFASIDEANAHLRRWALEVAGLRDHGTTHEQPLARFEREKEALQQLPATRYEITVWHRAKLHSDCHVVFDYAYYSAPYRMIGQHLWLAATPGRVEIFHEHERVATHERAKRRGERMTLADHLPPYKLEGVLVQPEVIQARAQGIGPSTDTLIGRLLGERPVDRVRTAQGILGLAKRYGPRRLEAACARALSFDDPRRTTIQGILQKGLDLVPPASTTDVTLPGPLPKTSLFARTALELLPASAQSKPN